jgi:hypothetical protein
MFGYLVAEPGLLTEAEYARYRGCYCGLCRDIKARWGQLARLSLTYDMTFLCLLFGSLYEPEETAGEGKCLPHPIEARAWWKSEFTDYAADMTVALAYLKCRDDWEDDSDPAALIEAAALRRAWLRVKEAYPRQGRAMEEGILALFVTLLGFDELIVKLVAQVVVIVLNYFISKFWVFKKSA